MNSFYSDYMSMTKALREASFESLIYLDSSLKNQKFSNNFSHII